VTPPPLVTVIIPALNEESDIAGCIDAVGEQDYGAEHIQLVLVDSGSTDGTVAEASAAARRHAFADVVLGHNTRRRTSISLNVGLDQAQGGYTGRVDARSRIEPAYVSTCVRLLKENGAIGVVGGAQVATARTSRHLDQGLARALRNRWATGLSRYRRGSASGPSDTVWMGFFRTDELRALGGWSEAVALNEDYDLNERYRRAGYVVWFEHTLHSAYLPRQSLGLLARQYFYFGRVKGTWWARGSRPAPRQLALVAAPVGASVALAVVVRRLGPVAVLTVPAGLIALEAAGADSTATAPVHAAAVASITTLACSWWAGTVIGFAGELVGVHHRHG